MAHTGFGDILSTIMSRPLFIANWKMNPQKAKEAQALFFEIERGVRGMKRTEVVLSIPFIYMPLFQKKTFVSLGAQDCFWEDKGAYTGEISPRQLKFLGCTHVIVGHSERKRYMGETADMINRKVLSVLRSGLHPVLCIGERKRGEKQHMAQQLRSALLGVKKRDAAKLVIVYEPEWAISSNKASRVAIPANAVVSADMMRQVLEEKFGKAAAKNIKILYGGSVDSRNVAGFMKEPSIQGVLVGHASLNAREFVRLVKNGQIG